MNGILSATIGSESLWALGLLLAHAAFTAYVFWAKRRNPEEATFWLMIVCLVPVLGVLLYLFFGITRVDRAHLRLRRRDLHTPRGRAWRLLFRKIGRLSRQLGEFRPPPEIAAGQVARTLDRFFPSTTMLDGNSVELLRDGSDAYPRMLQDILHARHCIRMQSFILLSDAVGRRLLQALEQKAHEGVDVKVLFDSFGSFKSYFSRTFRRCIFSRHPHLQIHAFSFVNLFAPWKFQMRNHRKLLIIDGAIAYSGGLNIAAENTRLPIVPRNRHIHDLHCRIEGPAVSQFSLSFFRDWHLTTRHSPHGMLCEADFTPPTPHGNTCLRVIPSGPGDLYEGSRTLFHAAVALAQRTLTLVTPYFVPNREFIHALGMAAARGVFVRIVVPAKNNHFYVDYAASNGFPELLRSGVHIYRRHGAFSHTKALLVDGEWGFMGSSNCDSRSFRLNYELDFCFQGGAFPAEIRTQLETELAQSEELLLVDVQRQSLPKQVLSGLCALLTPVL